MKGEEMDVNSIATSRHFKILSALENEKDPEKIKKLCLFYLYFLLNLFF